MRKMLWVAAVVVVFFGVLFVGTPRAAASDLIIEDNVVTGYTGDPVDVVIPDGVTAIGESAFEGCESLESIYLPDSVTSIGASAFCSCSVLSEINIPENVTTIEDHLFHGCYNLASITLPEQVTSIGDFAFAVCKSLTSVTIEGVITKIDDFAFDYCTELSAVTFEANDAYIGDYAFLDCSKLTQISITGSISYLGTFAFQNCNKLVYADISCHDATIGGFVFNYCKSLKQVSLTGSVCELGMFAFQGCKHMKEVYINFNHGVLEEFVFSECEELTTLTLEGAITSIGIYAFYNCGSLVTLALPEGIESIDIGAFLGCVSLETLYIPDGITSIGVGFFDNCPALKNIHIPDSVTSIEAEAFKSCISLVTIDLPDSITSIGEGAFRSCTSLTSITIPDGVTRIEANTFRGCKSLMRANLPASVIFIDDTAFIGCHKELSIYADPGTYAADFAQDYGISLNGQPVVMVESSLTVGKSQFGVLVWDFAAKEPLENAEVEISGLGTVFSNAEGLAVFDGVYNKEPTIYNIKTTLSDYQTNEGTIEVSSAKVSPVNLYKSGLGLNINRFYDVLSGTDYLKSSCVRYHNASSTREEREYVFEVHTVTNPIVEYRIIQNKIIKYRNDNGIFHLDFSKDFDAGHRIFVQAVDSAGNLTVSCELGVKIMDKYFDTEDTSVEFGNEMKVTVPEDFPILKGWDLDFGLSGFSPIYMEVEDDKIMLYVGLDDNILNTDGIDSKDKASIEDIIEGNKKSFKYFDLKNAAVYSGFAKIDGKFIGYAEGYIKYGQLYSITGGFILGIEGSYKQGFPFTLGPIPVYITVEVGGGVDEARFGWTQTYDGNQWSSIFENKELKCVFYGALGVGAGIPDVVCVGGEIKVTIDTLNRPGDGYNKTTGALKGSVIAKLGIFEESISADFLSKVIYEGYGDDAVAKNTSFDILNNQADFDLYSEDSFSFSHRKTLSEFYTVKTLTGETMVENNTFGNPMPKLIEHNGTPYLFWIKDNTNRDEKNRAMLVYSKNEGSGWTMPVAISDDGTADFDFDVATQGDEIYIVWQDSNAVVTGEEDPVLADYAEISEISFAALDTTTGAITTERLTSDTNLDSCPHIAAKGDEILVTWVSNDESEYFLNSGTNTIHSMLAEEGVFGEGGVVETTTSAVSSVDVGFLNDDYYVAYELDGDGDFSTITDREIYYKENASTAVQMTDNDVIDSKPHFAEYNGEEYMFWYSDGNLYYTDDLSDSAQTVFTDNTTGVNDSIEVIEGDGEVRIIWNSAFEKANGEVVTGVYASNLNDDGTWSQPYLLAETGHEASLPSGYMDGSECVLGYKRTVNDIVGVVVSTAEQDANITAEYVEFDEVTPDETLILNITATNAGMADIDSLDVVVYRNGSEIYRETVSTDMPVGEEAVIEAVGFTVPSDIQVSDEMEVELSLATDTDVTDNRLALELTRSDLFIEAETLFNDGEYIGNILIGNDSYFAEDATVYIRADAENGEVLKTYTYTDINNGANSFINISLNSLLEQTENDVLYFTIEGENDEVWVSNNVDYICINQDLAGDYALNNVAFSCTATHCSAAETEDGSICFTSMNGGSGNYLTSIDRGMTWSVRTDYQMLEPGIYTVLIKDEEDEGNRAVKTVAVLSPTTADFSGDGIVDMIDLQMMEAEYNGTNEAYDLNGDGVVNIFDLKLLSEIIQAEQ